jgi:hypothetical protein
MSVLNIRPVESGQSKAVIGIAGISGSGKTYTALLIARGMVESPSQIGFLDTENGRGSLYSDILDGPFLIGDLYPPFSPTRYAQAIKEFQDAGVKVLVIDSVTHEWEGEGGCDDIANAPKADGSARKVANWIGAKREHKQFMNVLLQSNMDIICCIRAREKTDFKDPTKPISLGIQPICEKNFMFEMTASLLMTNEGKNQTFLKIPSFLKPSFGNGQNYLGIDTGKKIRKWLSQGENEDPEITRIKSEALLICENGVDALTELWNTLTPSQKKNIKLISHFGVCKESAKAYDAQNLNPEEVDKVEFIKTLFKELESKIEASDCMVIQSVIDNKKTSEFDKVIYRLNKLKNEQ